MGDLLMFESDCTTLQVLYNSLRIKQLVEARGKETERKKFISKFGYLYPDRDQELTKVDDFQKLKDAVCNTEYEAMLNEVTDNQDGDQASEFESSGKNINDVIYTATSRRMSQAFLNGFHYGAFYAYLRLKEQEIKNVKFLAEMVSLKVARNAPGWNKFTLPFKWDQVEIENQARN